MFITPCKIEVLKNGKVRLLQPLEFRHKNILITLYNGFIWDLASIPSYLTSIVGCPFDYVMESALHDALYSTGLFDRETSDFYWYLALRSGGSYKNSVDKPLAKTLHAGVRVGGASHFKDGSIADAREFVGIEVL